MSDILSILNVTMLNKMSDSTLEPPGSFLCCENSHLRRNLFISTNAITAAQDLGVSKPVYFIQSCRSKSNARDRIHHKEHANLPLVSL